MRIMNLNLILLGLMSTAILPLRAQNTTNLPTSMYGIGELSASDGGRLSGMGNVGIALNRTGFPNTLNPAAITKMDTTCFTFDVGTAAAYARYSYLSDHSSSLTANPNRISLGFRAMPRWYIMLGAAPYSSVGYFIRTEEVIEGMPTSSLTSTFQGEGGLYRCYWTNAVRLTRQLSVGINMGIVMGTTTQSETQENATVEYRSKKRAFYTDFGLHYEVQSDPEGMLWSAGSVFAPSLPLAHDNTLTYENSSIDEELEKTYHEQQQYLPMHIGLGIAVQSPKWLLTADYNYTNWSRNSSSDTGFDYENQHKINIGSSYTLHPRRPRSTELMLGVGFGNSYISMKNQKMNYLEVSAGVSLPIRYSYLSLGATWRRQMNPDSHVMQECRWSINLNLTFGERISKSKLQ